MLKKKKSLEKRVSLIETRKKNRSDGSVSPVITKLRNELESRMMQVDDWIWTAVSDAYSHQQKVIRDSMKISEAKKRILMQHDIINWRWGRVEEIYEAYEIFKKAYQDVSREIYTKYEYDKDVEWYMKWSGQRK